MQKVVIPVIILIGVLQGCSAVKMKSRVQTGRTVAAETVSDILERNISRHDFYIQKAEISLLESNGTARFFALIKFKRPDSLSLSFKTRFGIEAARILITDDTLIISDRINKRTRTGKPEELKRKYGIEPRLVFTVLGDIIVDKRDESRRIKCQNGFCENDFIIGNRQVNYKIDCRNSKLIGANFHENGNDESLDLQFTDFLQVESVVIPGLIRARSDLNGISVMIKIDKAEIGYSGIVGFKSPANYKVTGLK